MDAMKLDQDNLLEKIQKDAKHSRKAELAGNLVGLLDEFKNHLEENRMIELENEFREVFNGLRPPSKQIKDVDIDPKSLSAKLKNIDGSLEDSAMLSAGEKQLYAVALLLAITEVSTRSFPLIIDTPLARLDIDNGTLNIMIIPQEPDKPFIKEAIKKIPILESSERKPLKSEMGKKAAD